MNLRLTSMGIVVLLCRLTLGGIFIYASLDKLAHPEAFAQAIHNYRMVPYSLLHGLALLLPVTEMVVGLAMVLGFWRRGAALLVGLMTIIFIVAIAAALSRGLDISCGCFNTDGGHGVGRELLARDVLLFLLCLPPLLASDGGPAISRLFSRD